MFERFVFYSFVAVYWPYVLIVYLAIGCWLVFYCKVTLTRFKLLDVLLLPVVCLIQLLA